MADKTAGYGTPENRPWFEGCRESGCRRTGHREGETAKAADARTGTAETDIARPGAAKAEYAGSDTAETVAVEAMLAKANFVETDVPETGVCFSRGGVGTYREGDAVTGNGAALPPDKPRDGIGTNPGNGIGHQLNRAGSGLRRDRGLKDP